MPDDMPAFTVRIAQLKIGFPQRGGLSLVSYFCHIGAFLFVRLQGMMKFAVVGGIGALLGFAMTYILTEYAHLYYLTSFLIAYVSTSAMCYILNHFWTFRQVRVKHSWFVGLVKYEVVDGVFIAVSVSETALLTEVFGLWYMASVVLAVVINYPIRYLLFRRYIWDVKSLEKGKT